MSIYLFLEFYAVFLDEKKLIQYIFPKNFCSVLILSWAKSNSLSTLSTQQSERYFAQHIPIKDEVLSQKSTIDSVGDKVILKGFTSSLSVSPMIFPPYAPTSRLLYLSNPLTSHEQNVILIYNKKWWSESDFLIANVFTGCPK